jgi:hypothetical protein
MRRKLGFDDVVMIVLSFGLGRFWMTWEWEEPREYKKKIRSLILHSIIGPYGTDATDTYIRDSHKYW